MLPGILCEFEVPAFTFARSGVVLLTGAHSSGVSIIFSTTSVKASRTPTAVLAEASTKSESIRSANALPSEVDTWRENSYRIESRPMNIFSENGLGRKDELYLVDFITHDDLHH